MRCTDMQIIFVHAVCMWVCLCVCSLRMQVALYFSDVRKDIIDMDLIRGNRVVHNSHPGHNVYVVNNAVNVPGWKRSAVRLNGRNQYLDLGANASCNGNLDLCENGFTFRSAVKPGQLVENSYWYSSAPYDIYYKNGRINADFRTPTRKWSVSSGTYRPNSWNLIEYSWHPARGLMMYVNGQLVATDNSPSINRIRYNINQKDYIGRAGTDMRIERYGQISIDDVQLWQASRDILIKRKLIDPGKMIKEQNTRFKALCVSVHDG